MPGVLVVGTSPKCGKTAVIAGLAAALKQAAFGIQAFKPLAFGSEGQPVSDQTYLNQVSQQYLPYETLLAADAQAVTSALWYRVLEQSRTLTYPGLLEAVDSLASPWQWHGALIKDAVDVAQTLSLPILVVNTLGPDAFARLRLALTFLQTRDCLPIGFIQTQLKPDHFVMEADALWLSREFGVPYLGTLPYSPSVQVESLQQGNIIRLTQDNIDLLPLQIGMELSL